jgi:enamine deaminase RidA (YjgF/YER057c/UK114 family)
MKFLQPPGWATPRGYANGVAARGTLVFVGGQIGWNGQQQFESDDFIARPPGPAQHRRRAEGGRCRAPSTWCA